MKKEFYLLYILVLSIVIYVFGIATVRYDLFPYPQVLSVKSSLFNKKIEIKPREKFVSDNEINVQKLYLTQKADIVMLGDSLTYSINWNELLGREVINRGMGYDTTEGYLKRIDIVYKLQPKKVFLNGGTNDFFEGNNVEEVFNNYKKIITILQEHKIKPYIQSVIFTRIKRINVSIEKVNYLLKDYCKQNNIVYIDLNKKLSKDNMLIEEYTRDGAHLTAKGYAVWRDIIKEYME